MAANTARKQVLRLAVLGIAAMFVVGFLSGAIAKGTDDALLPKPEIHLQPVPIWGGVVEHASGDHGHGEVYKLNPSGFAITNTLLSSLVTSILIIALFFLATRKIAMVPKGVQNFIEAIISAMYGFVESVAGSNNARRFFPFFATIFLFVLVNAWLGLLPIYPSLGFKDIETGEITRHLLRPAGTDLNMPLALAIVSFVFVEYWAIRTLGLGYFKKFFRFSGLIRVRNPQTLFQAFIDIFVGLLELLSELVRVVSFTFRLFGNMTAGEILLLVTAFLVPFVFVLPFYGLEILVGFIQALIFAGLTLVFVTIAIMPHEGEGH